MVHREIDEPFSGLVYIPRNAGWMPDRFCSIGLFAVVPAATAVFRAAAVAVVFLGVSVLVDAVALAAAAAAVGAGAGTGTGTAGTAVIVVVVVVAVVLGLTLESILVVNGRVFSYLLSFLNLFELLLLPPVVVILSDAERCGRDFESERCLRGSSLRERDREEVIISVGWVEVKRSRWRSSSSALIASAVAESESVSRESR